MSRGSVRSRTSLGWQAGCRHWHNGGGGHEGAIKAEIQVGLFTSGALVITTGKKKIQGTWGKRNERCGGKCGE